MPAAQQTNSDSRASDESQARPGASSDQDASKSRVRRDRHLEREASKLLDRVKAAGEPLPQAWNAALRERKVSGSVLATAFLILHERRQYESCIQGIEAAIRNDLAQPWMYDVLAAVMSVAGRPQKDIDRVLLSRIDFADGNEAQMFVTASVLSQFGAYEQAMNLCREAAKRNPWQPTTWSMAKSIADRSKDQNSIIWSRLGVLRYVWGLNHEIDHREARAVLQEIVEGIEDSQQRQQLEQQIRVASLRDLRIRIEWVGDADLDLMVTEPNGQTCSFKNGLTTNGGMLIQQSDGGRRRQVEEYVCVEALAGEYAVRIRNLFGRLITGRVRVTVIRHEGSPDEQKQAAFYEVGRDGLEIVVPLKNGRGGAASSK